MLLVRPSEMLRWKSKRAGWPAWFDARYEKRLKRRHSTFRRALSDVLNSTGPSRVFVETGCVREKNDYSAGYSTVLFAEVLAKYGGQLHTVDNSERNMTLCRKLTKRYAHVIAYHVRDSVAFLKQWPHEHAAARIDLLYLDSFDYPRSPKDGPQEPSQEHCLAELEAALPSLHERSVVLIDDGDLPGGGKPLLAKRRLSELGWRCLIDDYQTLWTRT